MGYHVELVRNGRHKVAWEELAVAAASRAGWGVDHAKRQIEIVIHGEPRGVLIWEVDAPWLKSPDDDALVALIDLAADLDARVRGDELESYRSPEDWYIHPDDTAAHAAATYASQDFLARRKRNKLLWDGFRFLVLAFLAILLVHRILNGTAP